MKKILYSLILLFLFFPCFVHAQDEKQRIYLIGINFDRGKFSLGEVSTKLGFVPGKEDENGMGDYRYWIKILSYTGETLEEQMFSISNQVSFSPPIEGEISTEPSGMVTQDQVQGLAILSYHNDGKFLELYDANKRFVEKKDISYLSDVCSDKTCQDHESFENCPQDCLAAGKDDYCDINNTEGDVDCKNIKIVKPESQEASSTVEDLEKKETNIKYYIFAGIGITILIFIYAAYYFLVKKNDELS